jgi:RNA polymerase sigma-70 factor (ECF subfamily)
MKEYISAELVKKAQNGDKFALEDLIVRSDDIIHKTIYSFPLASEAEDLLQEIRIKIIEKLPKVKNAQAFPSWLHTLSHNHCINFLEKKRPVLLDERQQPDSTDEDDTQCILETQSINRTSYSEFEKCEASLEHKERIVKTAKAVGMETFGLLNEVYGYGLTLKELVSLGSLKKSAHDDRIKIARARWILEEANEKWQTYDLQEAKDKLSIIVSEFKPYDDYKDKRFFLASALSRLGDINQVQGQIYGPNKSIDCFLRAKKIWDSLRDKKMAFYAVHMIALCNNITKNYRQALRYLEEVKESYEGKGAHTRYLLGCLEKDTGAIYLNMGETKLAQRHIQRSLAMLEDADDREAYFAALRRRGQIEVKFRHFDKAFITIGETIREIPPYRALHHLQAKIATINLLLLENNTNQALQYAAEAEITCKEFGFHHQLSSLNEILAHHNIIQPT